jgi:hypothetical protein
MINYKRLINSQTLSDSHVRSVFELAFNNQVRQGDLLLVCMHGHFDQDMLGAKLADNRRASPLVTGLGKDGLIYDYQYNSVRTLTDLSISIEENAYLLKDEDSRNFKLLKYEIMGNVYNAIWESHYYIKTLYNLLRLCEGLEYKWENEIKIKNYQTFWKDEIDAKLKIHSSSLHRIVGIAYQRHVRNSVAHRKYFIQDDKIFFYDGKYSTVLSTHTWGKMIAMTIGLYQSVFKEVYRYMHEVYPQVSKELHYGQSIEGPSYYDKTKHNVWFIKYNNHLKRWE